MLQTRVDSGLDGVIVADTVMSEVDGEEGRLVVRGHNLQELVSSRGFEGVAALLWEGYAEGGGDEAAVRKGMADARVRAFADVPKLLAATAGLTPVEGLRVGLGMLPDSERLPHQYLVCGALPVFLAALLNARKKLSPIAPDPSLTTAQDLLRMIRGQRAGEVFEKGLDAYLATVADHGFNASTFTARVVASTHAGLISAVLAALCALKGPLHGGAPGPVLDMLDDIGEASRAEAWFDDAFAKGTTLMGFGHRIYKVRDPRA
ncbi:MAG: citrate synthase/methylcitrate synthase, partial [Alphaproteobacteria bacterium]|nr:citrate synthase/methylcitrate synthase [Alphaproteobacteria bacterium]